MDNHTYYWVIKLKIQLPWCRWVFFLLPCHVDRFLLIHLCKASSSWTLMIHISIRVGEDNRYLQGQHIYQRPHPWNTRYSKLSTIVLNSTHRGKKELLSAACWPVPDSKGQEDQACNWWNSTPYNCYNARLWCSPSMHLKLFIKHQLTDITMVN